MIPVELKVVQYYLIEVSGDPFKIAAITAVNASNVPTTFGPLISIATVQFGLTFDGSRF